MDTIKDLSKSVCFFISGVLLLVGFFHLTDPRPALKKKETEHPARFEEVGTVVIEYRVNGDLTGTIYKDGETEIEYLYIWDGAGNGGPAITRLWKKGE